MQPSQPRIQYTTFMPTEASAPTLPTLPTPTPSRHCYERFSKRLTLGLAIAKLAPVNVISKASLFEAALATENPQLVEKATRWYELATKNDFGSFVDLQGVFPSVDWVGGRLVFNLGSYRLICGVSFLRKTFFFKALLSHAAYDQGGWKS